MIGFSVDFFQALSVLFFSPSSSSSTFSSLYSLQMKDPKGFPITLKQYQCHTILFSICSHLQHTNHAPILLYFCGDYSLYTHIKIWN